MSAAPAAPGDATLVLPPSRRILITIGVMSASTLMALDSTIANVALPSMRGSLSATTDQIAWVVTGYIIASAIATPLVAALSGRLGRKTIFLSSIVAFSVTSALCGLASSLGELVVFRVLQGVSGAAFYPLSQAILLDITPRERYGQSMAIFGLGVMVGPILGPTLGGFLTEELSWRWVFFINVPFTVGSFVLLALFLPGAARDRSRPFDLFGFVLLSLALGSLQLMLDRGEGQDWFASREILLELGIGSTALFMFLVHMLTSPSPYVSPAVFRDRNFANGLIVSAAVGVVLYSGSIVMSTFLQELRGFDVMQAGLLLAPRGLGTAVGMLLVGRLIQRYDPRGILLVGLTIVAISLVDMAHFTARTDVMPILFSGVLQGLGLGLVFVPISTIGFATLPPALRNEGASLHTLSRSLGGSAGVALSAAILSARTEGDFARSLADVAPLDRDFARLAGPLLDLSSPQGLEIVRLMLARNALETAHQATFWFLFAMVLAAVPLLLLLRRPPRAGVPAPTSAAPAPHPSDAAPEA
ncbi:MAG: DHA2 family efflux MFS transporter permease subunit, partial [Alphaproteobacteria bacterium]|nr:DHA2 family efflux MFS transporter permease subunit [Alphaproteobacteria bacterium]